MLYKKIFSDGLSFPNSYVIPEQNKIIDKTAEGYTYTFLNVQKVSEKFTVLGKIDTLGNIIRTLKIPTPITVTQLSQDTSLLEYTKPFTMIPVGNNFLTVGIHDSLIKESNHNRGFSWLVLTKYDSAFNWIASNRYEVNFPVVEPLFEITDPFKVEFSPDSTKFILSFNSKDYNSGSLWSTLIAVFDTSGALLNSSKKNISGKDLRAFDMKINTDFSIYLLTQFDTTVAILKLDSMLNTTQSVSYIGPGSRWKPVCLNIKDESVSVVMTKNSYMSNIIFETDSQLSITNAKMLLSDSLYFLQGAFAFGDSGITIFTGKAYNDFYYEIYQDVLFIKSLDSVQFGIRRGENYESYPGFWTSLDNIHALIPVYNGFVALIYADHPDVHFGQFSDMILSRLGPNTDECNSVLANSSMYYFSTTTLISSPFQVNDSSIAMTMNSSFINDTLVNYFNTTDCTGYVNVEQTSFFGTDEMSLFPNPTQGKFNIGLLDSGSYLNLQIYNSMGELISNKIESDKQEIQIDLTNYPAGIYFVQAATSEEIYRGKVLKN